jgi:uncharacterized phage protein (TIGR02216 family)
VAPEPFPWDEAMAFGFGRLRLSPHAFWAMTPRELAAAHRGMFGARPGAPDRAALAALLAAFPDG